MGKNVFVTGATGFLGRNLLKEMLEQDDDSSFYLLSRSEASDRAIKERFPFESPERLVLVRGDVTQPLVGLSVEDKRRLSGLITEVRHDAASTSFDDNQSDKIEATNVTGTQNVLDTIRRFSKLEDFFYTSTAYVCGKDTGSVAEGRLTNQKDFKNTYERTKLESEARVRDSGLPFTIMRPSIVMGDSRTKDHQGEIRMVYGYLLAMYYSALSDLGRKEGFLKNLEGIASGSPPKKIDVRLFGYEGVTRNLIPVDDVVNVSLAIRNDPTRVGKTYNVVNENNITVSTMLDSIQKSLGVTGYRFDGDFHPHNGDSSKAESLAYKMTGPFHPYVEIPEPTWVTDNVKALHVPRVPMTRDLFQGYMNHFVQKEIVDKIKKSA